MPGTKNPQFRTKQHTKNRPGRNGAIFFITAIWEIMSIGWRLWNAT